MKIKVDKKITISYNDNSWAEYLWYEYNKTWVCKNGHHSSGFFYHFPHHEKIITDIEMSLILLRGD
jgi:hypothetical protein